MHRIVLSDHISWQKVPNNAFAFVYNIKSHKYYKFEETEIYIWEIIAENDGVTLIEITKSVALNYDLKYEEIQKDINIFIDSLLSIGVIEYVE